MTQFEVSHASDMELLEATRSGDTNAYGELWRRHAGAGQKAASSIAPSLDPQDLTAEAFAKILRALKGGKGPTGAFRPYLYQVQRSLAADWLTERDPLSKSTNEPLEAIPDLDTPWPWDDQALDEETAVQAFAQLEDRWKTVLWYTEVERMPPRKIATILGTSPNGVSKLAARAREGLRSAWLDAHLSKKLFSPECEIPLKNLRKMQEGRLSRATRAQVQAHVANCEACQNATEELTNVRQRMVAAVLVLIVGPGATAALAASFSGAAPAAAAAASLHPTPLTAGVSLAKKAGNALKSPLGVVAAASVVTVVAAGAFAAAMQMASNVAPAPVSAVDQSTTTSDNNSAVTTPVSEDRQAPETQGPEGNGSTGSDGNQTFEDTRVSPPPPEVKPPGKDSGGDGGSDGDGDGDGGGPIDDGYDHTLLPGYLCYFEGEGSGSHNIAGRSSSAGFLKVRITQPPSIIPVELIVANGVTTGTDATNWWFTESLTPLEKWPGLHPGEIRESRVELQLISNDGRRSPWSEIVLPLTPPPIESCGL